MKNILIAILVIGSATSLMAAQKYNGFTGKRSFQYLLN